MYRVDNSTAALVIPTPAGVGPNPNSFFTGGNPVGPVPATVVDADFLNAVQEEICNVITGAGITLSKTARNQLLTALQTLGRLRLTADLNLYVSTTGNDANNGLTSGTPFQTPQHAWNTIISLYDLAGFNVIVHCANGTYNASANAVLFAQGAPLGLTGSNTITFLGNTATPASCVFAGLSTASGVEAATGGNIVVSGITMTSVAAYGAVAQNGGQLTIGVDCAFGSCGGLAQIGAVQAGTLTVQVPYSIVAGTSVCHMVASGCGQLFPGGGTANISGAPTFTAQFAEVTSLGIMNCSGWTFTGSVAATGAKYLCTTNGVMIGTGASPSFFPCPTAGSTSLGGLYT